MRKPRKKWGYGKDCAGKPAKWRCRWVRHEITCGECGHHQGWEEWYDAEALSVRYDHEYRRGKCVRCGDEEPRIEKLKPGEFYKIFLPTPFPGSVITDLKDSELVGD